MALSLLHLVFLRFFEPMCQRGELAVALLAEACDAGIFACGLILILGDSTKDAFRLGGPLTIKVDFWSQFSVFMSCPPDSNSSSCRSPWTSPQHSPPAPHYSTQLAPSSPHNRNTPGQGTIICIDVALTITSRPPLKTTTQSKGTKKHYGSEGMGKND